MRRPSEGALAGGARAVRTLGRSGPPPPGDHCSRQEASGKEQDTSTQLSGGGGVHVGYVDCLHDHSQLGYEKQ